MEQLQKNAYKLFIVALVAVFIYFARSLIIPLALAGLLAMLFRGLSNKLEKRGHQRWFTALLATISFLGGLALIIGLLSWQLSEFTENLSEIQKRMTAQVTRFRDWIQDTIGMSHSEQKNMMEEQAKAISSKENGGIAAFALSTLNALVDFVLVIVYLFLLLFYRTRIKKFIIMIVPDQHRSNTMHIIRDATQVAQQYLGGLAAMISVLWVLYGVGFTILGIEGALFFAILCGVLEIIPFIGNLLGTTIAVLAVIAQGGSTEMILGVIGIYVMVQGLQTYILEPLIVGKQVNINPLFTIVALVAGELLWGPAGMILAIPIAGIIKITCDSIPALRPYGYLIGSEEKNNKNA